MRGAAWTRSRCSSATRRSAMCAARARRRGCCTSTRRMPARRCRRFSNSSRITPTSRSSRLKNTSRPSTIFLSGLWNRRKIIMFKIIIRLLSFFNKEINEIRRQPRLVLSLIFGPFLILLLFGVGYAGERPKLKTALVVPQSGLEDVNLEELKRAISANFRLVSVDSDEEAAMAKLRSREVDVVEIIPSDVEDRLLRGEQAPVEIRYNEISPLNEQWIQYLGYAQVNEINKAIQIQVVQSLQAELQKNGVKNTIPPQVLVSPMQQKYDNLRGKSLSFMSFYAPSVLA